MDRNKIVETITGLGQTASQFWTNETSREFLSALEAVGLVVVPMEATSDMIRAGIGEDNELDYYYYLVPWFAGKWRAMTAAALGEKGSDNA